MTVVDSASDIVVLMLVFDSHRQPLNGYYLGALLFLRLEEEYWWSVFFIENFLDCI